MGYKNLNIDQERLAEVLSNQDSFKIDKPIRIKKNKNGSRNITILKEGVEASISVFLNKGGTTSFCAIGKNHDLSNLFIDYLIEECKRSNSKGNVISYKNIEQADFDLLLEYFGEDDSIVEDIQPYKKNDQLEVYKLHSIYKDEITITRYSNKTILIQGRPLYLFNEAKSFINELIIDFNQVVEVESDTYKIDIDANEVRSELKDRLFSVYDQIDEKILKVMTPALSLMKIDVNLEDYSCCIYPALRGLEGYIRMLFNNFSTDHKSANKIGVYFDETKDYQPKQFLIDDLKNPVVCNALKSAYVIYQKHRNPLFHTDDKNAQLTRLTHTKETANSLINEIFDVINQTFYQVLNAK